MQKMIEELLTPLIKSLTELVQKGTEAASISLEREKSKSTDYDEMSYSKTKVEMLFDKLSSAKRHLSDLENDGSFDEVQNRSELEEKIISYQSKVIISLQKEILMELT